MALRAGDRIGQYEVVSSLGTGGMGEVLRARDTRLGRQVALKVLPDEVASDPDRVARFRREAQLLATLNHPHIAAIYGLEESGAAPALVLELVEGETLAERLAHAGSGATGSGLKAQGSGIRDQGSGLPLDEALSIARQMAEALEAAHEQGVIHRDLKPANVKLRPDGVVKVLDFGLAKAIEPAADVAGQSQAPTLTSPAVTRVGVVLGTAAYMSPEQARGLAVDRSADIWAWGCVLYEMLTGRRAFPGDDVTETIAAVLRGEPDWAALPPDTPAAVRRLLRRCLAKDRRRRLADVRDARLEIDEAGDAGPADSDGPPSASRRDWVILAAALAVCLSSGVAVAMWLLGANGTTAAPELRLDIATTPTTDLVSMALSPDGEKLAYVASSDGRPRLWLRFLTTGEARSLPGTDGARFPFWSPDSRSIGFFANERVSRIDVDGGGFRELAPAPVGAGGTWNEEGFVLYASTPDGGILRVSSEGSEFRLPDARQMLGGRRFPQFLPDGRQYLYFVAGGEAPGVYVGDTESADERRLVDSDAAAVFVPPGEMLFVRAGQLLSQRFDPERLALEGDATPIADGVVIDAFGAAAVSGSLTGAVAYRTGSDNRVRQLAWLDREGRPTRPALAPDPFNPVNAALDLAGRRIALNRSLRGNADVWMLDLARRAYDRLTTSPPPEIYPVWSPAGDRLVYGRPQPGRTGFALFEMHLGTRTEALVVDAPGNLIPIDWSADGKVLLYRTNTSLFQWDVWALPLDDRQNPFPVAADPKVDERTAALSADGRFVAFESNQSGRYEVYVQGFPASSNRTLVSTGGGLQPRWRDDGSELFYVAPDGRLMAVPMGPAEGGGLEPGAPVPLFVTRIGSTLDGGSGQEYIVLPGGQEFLMNTLVETDAAPITLILNRRVP